MSPSGNLLFNKTKTGTAQFRCEQLNVTIAGLCTIHIDLTRSFLTKSDIYKSEKIMQYN